MGWNKKTAAALTGAALVAGTGGVFLGANFSDTGSGTSGSAGQASTGDAHTEDMERFEQVYSTISEDYMNEVDSGQLMEGAMEGMIEELGDPHSSYMNQEMSEEFNQSLESSFEGIGAEVSLIDDTVTIVAPFQDSPAEQAGLQPNDQVLEVDGESTEGETLNETVLRIRGEQGTDVTLTVQRAGSSEPFDVVVERDEIPVETVQSEIIEEDGAQIGHLSLTSFGESTASEFEEQLNSLEEEGMDALVIDVRGNPGGYLNAVEEIGELVISSDKPLVQIEDRNEQVEEFTSDLAEPKDYPIVGVIDEGSVSASEILAGALKEAGSYDLVGQTTYGKGTVQQSMELGDGSQLKLSMFKWLTPDGNWIDGEGVEPTIEVEQPDYFTSAALDPEDPLELDQVGEDIGTAQNMLQGLGYEPGRSDGYFNEETETAVQNFQEEQDLEANGTIDEDTAEALNQALLENIRDPENDAQLERALQEAAEQSSE